MQNIGYHTNQPIIIELNRCKIKTKKNKPSEDQFWDKNKKMSMGHHLLVYVEKTLILLKMRPPSSYM